MSDDRSATATVVPENAMATGQGADDEPTQTIGDRHPDAQQAQDSAATDADAARKQLGGESHNGQKSSDRGATPEPREARPVTASDAPEEDGGAEE